MKQYLKIEKTADPETLQFLYGKSYDELKSMSPDVITWNMGGADEFVLVPSEKLDQFPILSISREDFISNGYDASHLSDKEMRKIANTIRELLCESYMHDIIVDLADESEMPNIEVEEGGD